MDNWQSTPSENFSFGLILGLIPALLILIISFLLTNWVTQLIFNSYKQKLSTDKDLFISYTATWTLTAYFINMIIIKPIILNTGFAMVAIAVSKFVFSPVPLMLFQFAMWTYQYNASAKTIAIQQNDFKSKIISFIILVTTTFLLTLLFATFLSQKMRGRWLLGEIMDLENLFMILPTIAFLYFKSIKKYSA
jgi:hypothetical protein